MNDKVIHVDRWRTNVPTDITDIVEKYRPKLIETRVENGLTIHVYEARHAARH